MAKPSGRYRILSFGMCAPTFCPGYIAFSMRKPISSKCHESLSVGCHLRRCAMRSFCMSIPNIGNSITSFNVCLPAYGTNAASRYELSEVIWYVCVSQLRETDKIERVVVVQPKIFEVFLRFSNTHLEFTHI